MGLAILTQSGILEPSPGLGWPKFNKIDRVTDTVRLTYLTCRHHFSFVRDADTNEKGPRLLYI